MLDQAFEALKTYDWGTDRKALNPIDEALVATQDDAAARQELETRLAAVLKTDVSRDAKDFVCRKLMVIGTAASVPTLAELLPQTDHSHMARYALERIPAPEAAQAMRDALPKLDGALKIGVIGSLGARGDAGGVTALADLIGDSDTAVARAAAYALGAIRTADAAKALADAKPSDGPVKSAVTDASFSCAEGLLAAGKSAEARAIYSSFMSGNQPKHIRLAATNGMLACAQKSN
jgi:HEAT repeat protein